MNISKRLKAMASDIASDVIEECNIAKRLEDSGEYADAARSMGEWWKGIGIRPVVDDLPTSKRASVLSRVGALSGWLGSMQQVPNSQEKAKDLIGEGANLFETINDWHNWADARSDLAVCYWREGAYDEARVVLQDILGGDLVFPPELKAKILLRLVTVETSTKRFETASFLLNQVDSLIKDKENPLLLGKFYFYRAFVTRRRAEEEDQPNLLDSSIEDYRLAVGFYQQARHLQFVASTEINLGYVFLTLDKYSKAHLHFDAALEILAHQKDKRLAASVYDNKARTFIAQNRISDAQLAALTSVNMLREGGENATLSESLTTLAIVLSRGGELKEAIQTFVEAKEAALKVGDRESAGNAVLTHIEELQAYLTPVVIRKLYLDADELLNNSPKIGTINRLKVIARKQLEINNTDALFKSEKFVSWKNFSLSDAVHTFESEIILKAINDAGGRVTKAAKLLGMPHQSLSIILHSRHKDLKQYCVQRKPRKDGKVKTH